MKELAAPLPLAVPLVPQYWEWLRRTVGHPLPASAKTFKRYQGKELPNAGQVMLIRIARVKWVGDKIPKLGKLRSSNRGT